MTYISDESLMAIMWHGESLADACHENWAPWNLLIVIVAGRKSSSSTRLRVGSK